MSNFKNFLKEIFMPEFLAKEITPEFLEEKKIELVLTEKYIKWLKKRLMVLESAQKSREGKGIKKDPHLDETVNLLKQELAKDELKYYFK